MCAMATSRILVVEDSPSIRLPLVVALQGQGFEARGLPDGEGFEDELTQFSPSLVILDVNLPGGRDGFELLDVARQRSTAGVVMLTARDTPPDRVRGLNGGADDYVVKPFLMVELVARVKAVLRRVGAGGASTTVGDLEIADEANSVTRAGQQVALTDTERKLLAYLASSPGRVVSKTQLLTAVWGYEGFDPNIVEVHMSSLRRKLEAHGPRVVHTVRGRGYRLAES